MKPVPSKSKSSPLRMMSLAAVVIFVGFQNCSPSFQNPEDVDPTLAALGNEDPQPEPTPTPPPASFRAGDSFDRTALGNLYTPAMRALLDSSSYENFPGAKAIARAGNGLAAVRWTSTGDQDDADRMAVESCNVISGADCSLIVSNDSFAVDSAQIASAARMLVRSGSAALVAADVPMILDAERTSIQAYINTNSTQNPFKALSLAPSGEWRSAYGATQSEANRRALQICEFEAAITPCLIFAEGNQRVFQLANWDRESSLKLFPADVLQSQLPFIYDSDVSNLDQIFVDINQGFVASIAIGKTGSFAGNRQPLKEDADAKALEQCRTYDPTCFLYSSNKKVSLRWDQLPSKNILRAVTCAVPRANCQAHKERGCAAATRWVVESGNLTTKSCN